MPKSVPLRESRRGPGERRKCRYSHYRSANVDSKLLQAVEPYRTGNQSPEQPSGKHCLKTIVQIRKRQKPKRNASVNKANGQTHEQVPQPALAWHQQQSTEKDRIWKPKRRWRGLAKAGHILVGERVCSSENQ